MVGSLNCLGLLPTFKKHLLVRDFVKYKLFICSVQETHIKSDQPDNLTELKSTESSTTLDFFHTDNNHHHGVRILACKSLGAVFKAYSDRIWTASFKLCISDSSSSK